MAWLYINSAAPEASEVGIISRTAQKVTRISGRSHAILNTIVRIKRKHASKLEGICVVSGPGSFSSIRTGVLIANILARIEQIPLYGIRLDQAQPVSTLVAQLDAKMIAPQAYVKPEYDAEPNITLAKSKTT
jgi:tRNA A37 threonylcarbamoyladenosine modification protein TsaB